MHILRKLLLLPDAISGRLFTDPRRNGEYRFAKSYIRDGMVVVDVGANIGEYSAHLLGLANVQVHCFEPVASTCKTLRERLATFTHSGQVVVNNAALGDCKGNAEMYVYSENAGSNSLYYHDYHADRSSNVKAESVKILTLDSYVASHNIRSVHFLKIDVEGHEISVIKGAQESLKAGIIACIQFEYNDYWKRSHHSILEMLDLLSRLNRFAIYRLTPWGKWPINRMRAPLDDYKQSNYLAVLAPKRHCA